MELGPENLSGYHVRSDSSELRKSGGSARSDDSGYVSNVDRRLSVEERFCYTPGSLIPIASANSTGPSAVISTSSSCSNPRSSLDHSFSLPEGGAHYCPYCKHSKPTYTFENWKRQMEEYEVFYLCMPNGPVENTEHGTRCVLCLKEDPDEEHLSRHNVSSCVGKSGEPHKISRKPDMILHLARHHVHSDDAAALADKWRHHLNKNLRFKDCSRCKPLGKPLRKPLRFSPNEFERPKQVDSIASDNFDVPEDTVVSGDVESSDQVGNMKVHTPNVSYKG